MMQMCERDILNALDWQVWDVNPESLALDLFTALSLEQSLMAMDDDYIQLLFKDIEESLTAALSGALLSLCHLLCYPEK